MNLATQLSYRPLNCQLVQSSCNLGWNIEEVYGGCWKRVGFFFFFFLSCAVNFVSTKCGSPNFTRWLLETLPSQSDIVIFLIVLPLKCSICTVPTAKGTHKYIFRSSERVLPESAAWQIIFDHMFISFVLNGFEEARNTLGSGICARTWWGGAGNKWECGEFLVSKHDGKWPGAKPPGMAPILIWPSDASWVACRCRFVDHRHSKAALLESWAAMVAEVRLYGLVWTVHVAFILLQALHSVC